MWVQQSDSAEVRCSPHFIHRYFFRATKHPLVLQDMTHIQPQTLKSLHLCRQVSVSGLKWIRPAAWLCIRNRLIAWLFTKLSKTKNEHELSVQQAVEKSFPHWLRSRGGSGLLICFRSFTEPHLREQERARENTASETSYTSRRWESRGEERKNCGTDGDCNR